MTIKEEFVVVHKKFDQKDPRLGRNVRHDSRSLQYAAPEVEDVSTLKSISHTRMVPTFNQGSVGSCTGNAATGNLGYEPFWSSAGDSVLSPTDANADEKYAVGVYSDATKIDTTDGTYPPTDTGSDGISVAKVLQGRGLISGYQHALTFNAVLTALASQAVIVGTTWNADMSSPDADGRLHITGSVQGGHEYVLDELDVENKRIWMHNSWGNGWGVNGRAYFTWDDFEALLKDYGDCTIFVPTSQPAPTPAPGPVSPTPDKPKPDFEAKFEQFFKGIKADFRHFLNSLKD